MTKKSPTGLEANVHSFNNCLSLLNSIFCEFRTKCKRKALRPKEIFLGGGLSGCSLSRWRLGQLQVQQSVAKN